MGIESVKFEDIKTFSGKCYVGMTEDDAKKAGKSIFKEFKKLNTERDNVLSFDEIMASREKKFKTKNGWAVGLGVYTAMQAFSGIFMQKYSITELAEMYKSSGLSGRTKGGQLIYTLLLFGITALVKHSANKIDKENSEMAKKYYSAIAA